MEAPADRKAILLIEGDAGDRAIHSQILHFVGFTVREAADPGEGLHAIREDPPDLVFLDLALPEGAAWRMIRALKQDPQTAAVEVVAITEHPVDPDALEAAGFCGQVEKPMKPFRVVEEAERCLGTMDWSIQGEEPLVASLGVQIEEW